MQRYLGRQQALQTHAIRVAVWAETRDLRKFLDALSGQTARGDFEGEDELRKAMAAFGVSQESCEG